jgi:hypothetical protein
LELFALDEARPLPRLGWELRVERVDPRLEREPALPEPVPLDFVRELPDWDPEFARATLVLLPWTASPKVLAGGITRTVDLKRSVAYSRRPSVKPSLGCSGSATSGGLHHW